MQTAERAPGGRRARREPRRPVGVWLSSCRECGRLHEPRDSLRDSSVCTHCSDAARPSPPAR